MPHISLIMVSYMHSAATFIRTFLPRGGWISWRLSAQVLMTVCSYRKCGTEHKTILCHSKGKGYHDICKKEAAIGSHCVEQNKPASKRQTAFALSYSNLNSKSCVCVSVCDHLCVFKEGGKWRGCWGLAGREGA